MNEGYVLPVIFQTKGKVYKCSQQFDSMQSEADLLSHDDSSELEILKAVNEDLCQQLAKLEIEKDSLEGAESNIEFLREKMYSLHRNTNKKLGRRNNEIYKQSERIDKQKSDFEKLFEKVSQMESQLQQLRKDKDRLRHRVDYWKTKSCNLKSSSEEQEIQEIVDNQKQM